MKSSIPPERAHTPLGGGGVGLVGGGCGRSIITAQRNRRVRKDRVVAEWEMGLPV
jgi:hypothetical protein